MKTFSKVIMLLALAIILIFGLAWLTRAATTVSLGTASDFAILAGTGITNTGATTIVGDIGSSPTHTETGLVPCPAADCVTLTGTNHNAADPNDAATVSAKTALVTAYNNAAGQTPASTVATELGGTTKNAGIYDSAAGTFGITGTLTLDAQGDANAVFIFKTASTLITANNSNVVLLNGAQACNVFWQVGSSATLGTGSTFKGNILASESATLTTGANVEGRVLAQNGAVTLDTNTITKPTCTVTSPSIPGISSQAREGTINVVKTVINDNGGIKTVADFPLFVNGVSVVSGVTYTFSAPASAFTITETQDPQYAQSFSGDCDANGQVGLIPGDQKFCIVINDDIGTFVATPPVPPLIDVVKVPSPLSLPAGPGPVTYTYTLRNIGTVPVTDITMVGDSCSPINFISGDTNADAKLDVTETWVYRCAKTLSETHTNTVVATGWANGLSTVDIAKSSVIVGVPVVPPLIHIVKKPSAFIITAGGEITYTYTVTNPGTVALSDVSVVDDKCTSVSGRSGDTNNNSRLDLAETWIYTCKTNLVTNTVNTAKASGVANGFLATDLSLATVVVTPKLPNTGIAPFMEKIPWNIVVPVLVVIFAISIFYFARRKSKV
jgi:hypothetical protein